MASDSRRLKAELKLILCQVTALVRDNTNTDIDTKRVTSIFISVFPILRIEILQCMEGLSLGMLYQMGPKYFHISCLMIHILHLQIFYVSKYSRYIVLHNSHLWDILCFKAPGQCTHPSGKVCHNISYSPRFLLGTFSVIYNFKYFEQVCRFSLPLLGPAVSSIFEISQILIYSFTTLLEVSL